MDFNPDESLRFLLSRKSTAILTEPAPNQEQLIDIINIACSAPDHGKLTPYRFIAVSGESRHLIGEAFAANFHREVPSFEKSKLEKIKAKAYVAPMMIFVVFSPVEGKVPEWEQQASAACAGFGISLGAHALGFGTIWKSIAVKIGPEIRNCLGLKSHETILGWINVGTTVRDTTPRDPVDTSKVLVCME